MTDIPSKCPKCGNIKSWKEDINPFTSGIPTAFGRVRTGVAIRGLLSGPFKRALGFYKVTYRCHNCGFQKKYDLPE